MVEILNTDGTTKFDTGIEVVRAGDVFRTHDCAGGEGIGPWMLATSDAKKIDKKVHVKAEFWMGVTDG